FETEFVRPAEVEHFLDDLALLIDLDGIDAEVLAFVRILRDRRLERVEDVAEPVLQNVAEPDQNRETETAKLQMFDKLLQVDGLVGFLRRMDADVSVRSDGKIVFPPPVDFVQLAGGRHRPRVPPPAR